MERSHGLSQRLEALEVPAKFGSDLAVAKSLAAAARAGAWENVKINLESIQDAEFKAGVQRRVDAL
jgi:formiminotetrahydrofolate cyclodeaminase